MSTWDAIGPPVGSALARIIFDLGETVGYRTDHDQARIELLRSFYSLALPGSLVPSELEILHARLLLPDGAMMPTLATLADGTWTLAEAQRIGRQGRTADGATCGHMFVKGEPVYRCRNCALDESCVLCSVCFNASDHTGHDVSFMTHTSGCGSCDCGDLEAWKRPVHCAVHTGAPVEATSIPPSFVAAFDDMLDQMFAFILATLELAPPTATPPKTAAAVRQILTPAERGRGAVDSSGRGPWSIVLWNDEKHNFHQVIDQVRRALGQDTTSRDFATRVALNVDVYVCARHCGVQLTTQGRDVILISNEPDRLVAAAHTINSIDLGVTIRSAADTFGEWAAGLLIDVLVDFANSRAGEDATVLRRLIARKLLSVERPSPFERLLRLDSRLWKSARLKLRELYVRLIALGGAEKHALGAQYGHAYAEVMDAYLMSDREPDQSVTTLSVQLLTVPSVAASLITTPQPYAPDFFHALVDMLYAFFTEHLEPPRTVGRRIKLPPKRYDIGEHTASGEGAAFKHKRYPHLFADLQHLITAAGANLRTDHVDTFAEFIALFSGMNTNKRAVGQHVEFESDTWVAAFNVTIQVARTIVVLGEALRKAPREQRDPAKIVTSLQHLLDSLWKCTHFWMNHSDPTAIVLTHTVQWAGRTHKVTPMDVMNEPVSFHHPLAWLWAELLKDVEILTTDSLASVGLPDLKSILAANPLRLIGALEQPVQVCALLAQAGAGCWVRNGFPMRAQHLHYRVYALRETTYDQDVYFIQTALCLLPSDLVVITLIERFGLVEWLQHATEPDYAHPTYEPAQAFAVAEELIGLMINLLGEVGTLAGWSAERCVRREIVHALALGQCALSDLTKRMAESWADHESFDAQLARVSTFRPPAGPTDVGVFLLRPDCYAEVDPYYFRYTRNQRDEAAKAVRTHLPGLTATAPIVPMRTVVEMGAFRSLTNVFSTHVFVELLEYALACACGLRADVAPEEVTSQSDALVDGVLQLIMLAIVSEPAAFSSALAAEPPSSLYAHLAILERAPKMDAFLPKVRWTLDQLALQAPARVSQWRRTETASGSEAVATPPLDEKRKAAQARQRAIMSQYSAQQAAVLASLGAEADDDEEEDDDDMVDGATVIGEPAPAAENCILCQEVCDSRRAYGSMAFVQATRLVRSMPSHAPSTFGLLRECLAGARDLNSETAREPTSATTWANAPAYATAYPRTAQPGLFASACGHVAHWRCLETYVKAVEQRHQDQERTRQQPEDLERLEYLCPLCKSLNNVLLPPASSVPVPAAMVEPGLEAFDAWASAHVARMASAPPLLDGARLLFRGVQTISAGNLHPWQIVGMGFDGLDPEDDSTIEGQMIERLESVIHPLSVEAHVVLERQPRFLPDEVIAHTLSCLEIAARGSATLDDCLNPATTRMLRALLSVARRLVEMNPTSHSSSAAADVVLSRVLGLTPGVRDASSMAIRRPFTILVEVAALVPSSFAPVAALGFYAEIVRVLVGLSEYLPLPDMAGHGLTGKETDVADMAAVAQLLLGVARSDSRMARLAPVDPLVLGKLVYTQVLPYLRRAVLLATVLGRRSTVAAGGDDGGSELTRLMDRLGVPGLEVIFGASVPTDSPAALFRRRIELMVGERERRTTFGDAAAVEPTTVLEYPLAYELMRLPHRLDALVTETLGRRCEKCGTTPSDPAICLLCGDLLCAQSFCCMDSSDDEPVFGECNTHMWSCGGSSGLYYSVNKQLIVYLCANNGTFAASPFLDQHGEVHSKRNGLRYLSPQRYDHVRRQWLTQAIPTLVARRIEASVEPGGWQSL